MSYKEIVNFTATKMRQLISDKQISSVELMEAHLNQINDVNPHVNAIVTLDVDLAMNQAKNLTNYLAKITRSEFYKVCQLHIKI